MPDHWWFHEARGDDLVSDDDHGGGGYDVDITQPEQSEPEAVPIEPSVFQLELRTDDHRRITITGDMALFSDRARLVTEGELLQLGSHIAEAFNAATHELEPAPESPHISSG